MLRGTPGRYSSARPCRRFWTNLERHLPTVGLEHLSSAATTSFVFPSPQANTIFDLSARACGLFGRRAQRERVSLSSSDSTRGAFGRPRSAMRTSIVAHENARRRSEIPDYPIYLTNLRIGRLEVADIAEPGEASQFGGIVRRRQERPRWLKQSRAPCGYSRVLLHAGVL